MNKKRLAILGVAIFFVVLIAGVFHQENRGELIYTSSEDIILRMENKETFVVYLGTTTCSFCIRYKTELEKVIGKKDLIIYGVMINQGNANMNQTLAEQFELHGTPQTYWIVNGKRADTLVGYVSADEVISWLQQNKIIQ